MRNLIFAISVFFLSLSFEAFAAKVTATSQVTSTDIGLLDASSGSGSVRVAASNACTLVSGAVSILGSGACQTGSFSVTACRTAGGNSRNIQVFLANPSTLTSGGNNVTVNYISFSPTSSVVSQTLSNAVANLSGSQTITIPVYMRVTVGANQVAGTYTGNFTFYACSCDATGCPSSLASCESSIYQSACN